MTENNHKTVLTGGCQCGAIRFAVSEVPARISICHCRMCQKAGGGPMMAFARVEKAQLRWTNGAPSIFRSSSVA